MSTYSTGSSVSQRSLGKYETLSSFKEWKNNLQHHLSQNPDFTDFLHPSFCWKSSSDALKHKDVQDIDHLQRFLAAIANFCPPDLNNAILNKTTCLKDIYNLILSFYRLTPSESSFMRFATLQRENVGGVLDTPEHLFKRLRQHVKDNLLLSSGDLLYQGKRPLTDEELSPTTERLIVLRWLEVLNPSLPDVVARVFDKELRSKTLVDLQPMICEHVEPMVLQIEREKSNQEAVVLGSSSITNGECLNSSVIERSAACGAVWPDLIQEDIKIKFTPRDSEDILQASNIEVGEDAREKTKETTPSPVNDAEEEVEDHPQCVRPRMQIIESPQYKVKMNNISVTMVLDTGCTGSLISLEICELAEVEILASKHCAVQADGDSPLKVVGEVHTNILMDDYLSLPVNALVVSKLKAGFIVGMAFMKRHKVKIDMENNTLSFKR